jgi:hypothetical protein
MSVIIAKYGKKPQKSEAFCYTLAEFLIETTKSWVKGNEYRKKPQKTLAFRVDSVAFC